MKKLAYKKIFFITILYFKVSVSLSQVISSFDFNSYPLTSASYGPNAIYINPASATNGEGVYMTTSGPNVGIDLIVPGWAFDVQSIALVFDYTRRENEVVFFRRDGLIISMNGGNVRIQYQTYNFSGNGTVSYDFSNVYTIPYGVRFFLGFSYNHITGVAALYNNGVIVWSYDGPNNRSLRFFGGNTYIGELMDGTGSNEPSLYSFTAYNVPNVSLPVVLSDFKAIINYDKIILKWTTLSEQNNSHFEIEHSNNNTNWHNIGTVKGNFNSNYPIEYTFEHNNPLIGKNYYRIKQVDYDGKFETFKPISIEFKNTNNSNNINIYPNPVNLEYFTISINEDFNGIISMYSLNGVLLHTEEIKTNQNEITISNKPSFVGEAILVLTDFDNKDNKYFRISFKK